MSQSDDTQGNAPTYYVGIGASAGGLEALDTFFTHMPTDSGMAFIVIQHLSPDHKSLMVELLSKRTSMPVKRAEEGMRVEPDTVYLIPPKKELRIFHGKLVLRDFQQRHVPNLPIDTFFLSLAEDAGERAVGIILSGTGSDGVRGVRALKEYGGMVLVQDSESARFDGMPSAAKSTGLVDIDLPPEQMPEKLVSFISHPVNRAAGAESPVVQDDDGVARIFSMLREKTKVDFTYYKQSTVMRRIQRRLTVNQISDIREYAEFLQSRPGELTTLYRELLIGVTSFFRDETVFYQLQENWLPDLMEHSETSELRFWVAGCSTGEEAYTLAILAQEAQRESGRAVNVKIFATDIDRDAIVFAGNGLYPESIAADLPEGILSRYFIRRDDHFQVDRKTREMVVFAQHNLIKDPPFTNIDLISCRNLMIYLQPVLQEKVVDHFNFSLRPGGLLLLGTSETMGEAAKHFETLSHKCKVFRSRGTGRASSLAKQPVSIPEAVQKPSFQVKAPNRATSRTEERIQEQLLQRMSSEFSSLAAVVNENLELIHLAGDASGYLRPPAGRQVNDVTKMAERELAIPLATGLQRVFKTGESLRYGNIRLGNDGDQRMVELGIHPMSSMPGQLDLAAIFLREQVKPEDVCPENVRDFDINQEAEQRIKDLEQELQFKSENLQATVEELETSNEELQATNEELLASNEELQSTNEELQSVNEELHTVNAEYQTKILELTEMTNDLDNLMAATRIPTLFLDENLEVRKYTPESTRIFRLVQGDIGRPLSHISHDLKADPLEVAEEVLTTEKSLEREVTTIEGEWFLMRVLPYRIDSSQSSGLVITLIDISGLKRAESKLSRSAARMRSIFEAAPVGLGVVEGRVFRQISGQTCKLLGYAESELVGKSTRVMFSSDEEFERVGRIREEAGDDAGTVTMEATLRRNDGTDFPALLSFAPTDPDQPDGLQAFAVWDTTRKRRQEKELRRMTDLLNATQSLVSVGGWEWDVERESMFWTDEVYRIHGMNPEEVPGGSSEHIDRSLSCYRQQDVPVIREAFRKCVEEGVPYDLEFPFTDLNGRSTTIRTTASPVLDNGKVLKVIGNIMDIGEQDSGSAEESTG
ncbi:chemotaxis protein CheB [Desulfovibrio oxyclinae]|uniref:chemotaxis protein CheB n=1 Tax=Desulfovibrio oxyclinae TaxID=63560 RepID=UPI00036DD8CF|nr:chemotaxis protein CheB [Desulfovibrio oxyclinae]